MTLGTAADLTGTILAGVHSVVTRLPVNRLFAYGRMASALQLRNPYRGPDTFHGAERQARIAAARYPDVRGRRALWLLGRYLNTLRLELHFAPEGARAVAGAFDEGPAALEHLKARLPDLCDLEDYESLLALVGRALAFYRACPGEDIREFLALVERHRAGLVSWAIVDELDRDVLDHERAPPTELLVDSLTAAAGAPHARVFSAEALAA